nr:hypothetical protein [Steroidobacter cummioxidans]
MIRGQRLAHVIAPWRDRTDTERLADVSRQRLCDRAVVLHPIEFPDVPQIGIADRRVAHLVIARREVIAERGIADAAQRVGAAEALMHRVELAQRIVLAAAQHGLDGRPQCRLQLRFGIRIARAEYPLCETIELPRLHCRVEQRSQQHRREAAARHIREGVHGLTAIDTHRISAVVLGEMDFAGVAGGASDIEYVLTDGWIEVLGETDRQLVRIGRARLRIDHEAVFAHVIGIGEALARERQLQMHEPVVTKRAPRGALRHRGALGGVVVSLPLLGVLAVAPALIEPHVLVDRLERGNGVDRPQHEPQKSCHQHHTGDQPQCQHPTNQPPHRSLPVVFRIRFNSTGAQGTDRLTQRPQTTSQFQYFMVDEVAALIAVSHTSRRCSLPCLRYLAARHNG